MSGNILGKPITIYDVSREANVSPSTVSRVINGNSKVSPDKVKAVMEKIEELDFKPNALARGLSNKKTFTIGFIVPDIKNPYFSTMYYEVEQLAVQKGYTVILGNSNSDLEIESALLDTFVQKRVDGIVFMGGRVDNNTIKNKYLTELEEINKIIPIIITSKRNDLSLKQFYQNEHDAIFELVEHLSSRGCKSLGLLGGYNHINVSLWRRQNFKLACEKFEIEINSRWIIDGRFSIESGINAMKTLFEFTRIPDVACCVNDMVAIGALTYAGESGIVVPNDIMITGFDGSYISESVYPKITTIEFDYVKLASQLFTTLNCLINNSPVSIPQMSSPKVIVRASTRG